MIRRECLFVRGTELFSKRVLSSPGVERRVNDVSNGDEFMSDFLKIDSLGSLDVESLSIRLLRFHGFEEISRLYRYDLVADVRSKDIDKLTAEAILGQPIGFSINEKEVHRFGGIVRCLEFGEILQKDRRELFIQVVPDVWKLTQIHSSRSFPRKSVPELVAQVFKESPVQQKLIDQTTDSKVVHPPRVNPIQYDEDLMYFLARLLDEESIFYYFRNKRKSDVGREEFVIGDSATAYDGHRKSKVMDAEAELELHHPGSGSKIGPRTLVDWRRQLHFRPSSWSIQDYDYKKSRDFNMTKSEDSHSDAKDAYTKYQKSAGFFDKDYGKTLIDRHSEREKRSREYVRSSSDCAELYPGRFFQLKNHPANAENGEYVVTSVEHLAIDKDDLSSSENAYQNWFTCVDSSIPAVTCPLHSPHGNKKHRRYCELAGDHWKKIEGDDFETPSEAEVTIRQKNKKKKFDLPVPVPVEVGQPPQPETAFVCDSNGDYLPSSSSYGMVHTDEEQGFGRVLIRFPWEKKSEFQSGRWVRVAQMIAGQNWGGKFLPRVGDEVIVMYIDGSERKPLIVGTVYNDQHKLTNQAESKIWKLAHNDRNLFNTGDAESDRLDSTATNRLPITDSTRPGAPGGYQSQNIPSLQDPNVSGFRTNSNEQVGDGDRGYNELLFVDRPDNEQIYIRAEKDLNIFVQNDLNIEVGNTRNEIIRGEYYRVANVGPARNPYADIEPYPKSSDGGVLRSVAEGITYDYDKVYQVFTVDPYRAYDESWLELGSSHSGSDGDATYYRVSTETYADTENLTVGDTKEKYRGHFEEYFYGKKLEVVEGSVDDDPPTMHSKVTGHTKSEFHGKSFSEFTGSVVENKFTGVQVTDLYIGANAFGFHLGAKEEIVIAGTFSLFIGLALEIFAGNKAEFFFGNLASIHYGGKFEIAPDHKEINSKAAHYGATLGLNYLAAKIKAAIVEVG